MANVEKEKRAREYRGVRDEIRKEQLKTKNMSFKEKLAYFWYYYKIHTIVGILVLIFAGNFIYDIATAKDSAFNGIMLNSYGLSAENLQAGFSEYAGIDLNEYDCYIDTNSSLSVTSLSEYDMATSQKIIAQFQTNELDAVIFDSQAFNNYSGNEMFLDLRTVLSEEELSRYQDNLYYVDYAVIRAAREAAEKDITAENSDYGPPVVPDAAEILAEAELHRHPETMAEPVPVGVFMTDSAFIKKTECYSSLIPVYGVPASTQRPDAAVKYLNYLWSDSADFSEMIEAY